MPVPKSSIPDQHRILRSALACLLLLITAPLFAKGPEPPLRIPLENFGFQPLSHEFLLNGSSMLTLHYVDEKHLLLTFVVHRLIPRLANEPEDDQDRVVDAVLLELPTGRALARTSWHLHDHSQYLWSLGHGHFLLRIRDTLTTFAPLANLSTGDPFAQQPFLVSPDRRFAVLIVSPDADLLIIETVKRTPPAPKPKTPLFGPTPAPTPQLTERDPVQINFYRIHAGDDGGPVQAAFAGVMKSVKTGDVPVTTAGYLAVVDQGRPHWAFDFHSYSGKTDELSPFDSSCSPAPIFVSHSEFIAFGCRNAQTMQQIGGFNMRGEEMWEQGLFGDFIAPSLAYAPAGGRFALSRILVRNSAVPDQPISADEVSAQAVVVYQTGTGKQLLRADCSPVERAGQNFALSPNGLSLAVVHADAIEVYNLPPLTDKDAAAVKLAQTSAPADSNLPVHLTGHAESSTPDTDSAAQSDPQPNPQPATPNAPAAANSAPPNTSQTQQSDKSNPAPSPAPAATTNNPAAPTQTSGDAAPEQHRTPPTLYTLPDDKAPAKPKDQKDTPQ
jgi:hypothetical protein